MSDRKIVCEALDTILNKQDRIPTAELFEKVKEQVSIKDLVSFRLAVSGWFKDGSMAGFEPKLGRAGGWVRAGNVAEKKSTNITPADIEAELVEKQKNIQAISAALETILSTQERIVVADLYVKVTGQVSCDLNQFRAMVSGWLKDGTLKGFESRKGPTGGIYRRSVKSVQVEASEVSNDSSDDSVNDSSVNDSADESEEPELSDAVIQLNERQRIVQADMRNWSIQKLNGETWTGQYYYPTLPHALRGAAKVLTNQEFKSTMKGKYSLGDIAKLVELVEKNVVNRLAELNK